MIRDGDGYAHWIGIKVCERRYVRPNIEAAVTVAAVLDVGLGGILLFLVDATDKPQDKVSEMTCAERALLWTVDDGNSFDGRTI